MFAKAAMVVRCLATFVVCSISFSGWAQTADEIKAEAIKAAALVTLDVGVYTVQVSSADDGVGEVLVEVYEVTD